MEDVEVGRQNIVVEILEVVFIGGLLAEEEENDEDGEFWVSSVIFDLFTLREFWLTS